MIKIESFKSGNFVKSFEYKAFSPTLINSVYAWEDNELTALAEQSAVALGQLDAYAQLVPGIDQFIRMYVLKEATVSSRIEGTQTVMEEALMAERDIHPEQRDDWREVNNYVLALNNALKHLPRLPLSSRLLRKAHFDLMQSVRGSYKTPGEFRKTQNWIGGRTLKTAFYIPPVWNDIHPLMSDLENFLHAENTGLTHVMKIALAHYQFETIHPFLDGNGRLGRLLIPLYLIDQKIIHKPVLYLSDYFEKNRSFYYDHLTRVRTFGDLKSWMKFFMRGVIDTSNHGIRTLKEILALKKKCEEKRIDNLGRKVPSAKLLLNFLFRNPVSDAESMSHAIGLSTVSTYKLIDDFMKLGILKEMTGYKRNRKFIFEEYISIFKK